jgi:iron complex outermembrane recepter protein
LENQITMNARSGLMHVGRQILIGFILLFCLINRATGQNSPLNTQETNPKIAAGNSADVDPGNIDKLLDMVDKDISQLPQVNVTGHTGSPMLDTPVNTVERQESTVGKTPAAVFVITNEMIRRSGAVNVPDVLRMVPGLEVAQISSNEWAISSRGFNSRYANMLLVQIDGRTVYDLSFNGVYWDVQNLMLEDVERIEVIRGPGAAIWGANAVNGVISIITKKARDTQGVLLQGGAGTMERGFTNARAGGRIGKDLYYRTYGQWFERGQTMTQADGQADDPWRQVRSGFRMDYDASRADAMTLQGDYYNGYSNSLSSVASLDPPFMQTIGNTHVTGENIVYRWKHTTDEDSDWTFQSYYDRTQRHQEVVQFGVDRDLLDMDFQHRFPLGSRNDVIWGCGYRYTQDSFQNTFYQSVIPQNRTDHYYNYFLQDQITLMEDRWYLTAGSKFEHNPYTNFEFQPTVRLLWTPNNRQSIWGAVSRAVQTPARLTADGDFKLFPAVTQPVPGFVTLMGNPHLLSQELLAWELGIRTQSTERFSWDLAMFYNQYDKLRGAVTGTPYPVPPSPQPPDYIVYPWNTQNGPYGESYGMELATNYKVNERWRLQCAYTYLRVFLRADPNIVQLYFPGDSPVNQIYLQSSWDLGDHWQFDLTGRYVDSLFTVYGDIPSYIAMDTRLAWHDSKHLEIALVGRNLTHGYYPEFGSGSLVGPEVYGQITWRY